MKFGFTLASDKGAYELLTTALDNVEQLKSDFPKRDYGSGIKKLYFMPVVVNDYSRPEHLKESDYKNFRRRDKRLMLSLKFDYDTFRNLSEREATAALAERFLSAIDEYEALGVKDFDTDAFRRDVRAFFTERGLLPEAVGT